MKLINSRIVAVVAGAVVIATVGAGGAVASRLIGSDDIRNGGVKKEDIARDAVGGSEIAANSVGRYALSDELRELVEAAGPQGEPGPQGPQGEPGAQGDPASDVLGGLSGSAASDPAQRTAIKHLGGTVLNTSDRGVTHVTSINLQPGSYLVSSYGHFDRLNDTDAEYVAPTTETYGALVLWTGDEQFTDFADAAGTYFTGDISTKGFVEATASGSQVLVVEEPTTLHVGGFGYNENRSSFGSGTDSSAAQFSVYATVSAVKVG